VANCVVGAVVLLLGTVMGKSVTFTFKQLQFEGKVTSQAWLNTSWTPLLLLATCYWPLDNSCLTSFLSLLASKGLVT